MEDPHNEVKEWLAGVAPAIQKIKGHEGSVWHTLLTAEYSNELRDFAEWAYYFLEHQLTKSPAPASSLLPSNGEGAAADERDGWPAWLNDLRMYRDSWKQTGSILKNAKYKQRGMRLNLEDAEGGLTQAIDNLLVFAPQLLAENARLRAALSATPAPVVATEAGGAEYQLALMERHCEEFAALAEFWKVNAGEGITEPSFADLIKMGYLRPAKPLPPAPAPALVVSSGGGAADFGRFSNDLENRLPDAFTNAIGVLEHLNRDEIARRLQSVAAGWFTELKALRAAARALPAVEVEAAAERLQCLIVETGGQDFICSVKQWVNSGLSLSEFLRQEAGVLGDDDEDLSAVVNIHLDTRTQQELDNLPEYTG